jgi:Aldehyde dehydrogenase family
MTAPDHAPSGRGPARCVPLLRRGRWEPSLDVADVPGADGYQVSLAPRLMIMADARAAGPADADPGTPLGSASRRALLAEAAELFATGTVDLGPLGKQSADAFRDAMREVAGLPAALTDRWSAMLRDQVGRLAEPEWTVRRTLVVLPANTFTCLEAVGQAVLGSAEVWIRPSRREPVSALRFAAALLAAGWPASRLGFYPCGPEALAALLDATDRQIVFGGDETALRFARQDARPDAPQDARHPDALTFNGAGRGCALVAAGADPAAAARWLTPLVAADSGRFCKNVCTILCPDAPDLIADALASHLDAISLLTVDEHYPQAAVAPGRAAAYPPMIKERLRAGDRIVTVRGTLCPSDSRAAFLAPTLVLLKDPGTPAAPHPLLALEVPFPFASICAARPAFAQAVSARSRFVYAMASDPDPAGGPA